MLFLKNFFDNLVDLFLFVQYTEQREVFNMILSRLKILMAERDLKVSQVANDTGLSRTTLTALSNNTLKGIRLDTINTLCQYMNISTNDFFDYLPFDFEVISNSDSKYPFVKNEKRLSVVEKMNSRILGKSEKIFSLIGRINKSDDASIQLVEVLLGETRDSEVYKSQIRDFNSFLDRLKGSFKELFFQQIKEKLEDELNLKSNLSSYKFKFTFNNAFVEFVDDDDPFHDSPMDNDPFHGSSADDDPFRGSSTDDDPFHGSSADVRIEDMDNIEDPFTDDDLPF